jgi:23S rRNA pseudouridine2605 synthase
MEGRRSHFRSPQDQASRVSLKPSNSRASGHTFDLKPTDDDSKGDLRKVRLQKFLADSGVASRRAAEGLMTEGRVLVNGHTVTKLGSRVDPLHDRVTVDGQAVQPRRKLYVALNKPQGFLCTRRDERDRQVVGDLLPREWSNLFPVGRLDLESEGLIFLTNDGEFSLRLTHPRYGVIKRYVARVFGRITPEDLHRFTEGIMDDGELLKAARVWLLSANNSHSEVELELAQGKNREVRRLFTAVGREVETLKRIQIGPVRLGELPLGKWRVLTPAEVRSLLKTPA